MVPEVFFRNQEAETCIACPGHGEMDGRLWPRQNLVQRNPTFWPQDSTNLPKEVWLVWNIHCRMLHPRHIEDIVFEGEVGGIGMVDIDLLLEPGSLCEHSSDRTELFREINTCHFAAKMNGQSPGRPTDSTPHIDNTHFL